MAKHVFTIAEIVCALSLLPDATFTVELDSQDQAIIARAKNVHTGDTVKIVRR